MRFNIARPLILSTLVLGTTCGSLSLTAAENIQLKAFNQDITPPTIKHDPIRGSFETETPLAIDAIVTDNSGVKDVTLFYRTPGIGVYRAVRMAIKDRANNIFSATIPSSEVLYPKIEYYLQATDINGNTVVRAGKLFPLTVAVRNPNVARPPQNIASNSTTTTSTAKSSTNYWYWIIGGTVAALALANQADSGDDGPSKPSGGIDIVGSTPP